MVSQGLILPTCGGLLAEYEYQFLISLKRTFRARLVFESTFSAQRKRNSAKDGYGSNRKLVQRP